MNCGSRARCGRIRLMTSSFSKPSRPSCLARNFRHAARRDAFEQLVVAVGLRHERSLVDCLAMADASKPPSQVFLMSDGTTADFEEFFRKDPIGAAQYATGLAKATQQKFDGLEEMEKMPRRRG